MPTARIVKGDGCGFLSFVPFLQGQVSCAPVGLFTALDLNGFLGVWITCALLRLRHFFHFVHGVFDEKEIRNFNVVTCKDIYNYSLIQMWFVFVDLNVGALYQFCG